MKKIRLIHKIICTIIFFFFLSLSLVHAQEKDSVRISGVVFAQDSLHHLFGANIILNNKKGTISDLKGRFEFWASPLDTILFSHVGFQTLKVVIADTISMGDFAFGVFLANDTVNLSEVVVFPRNIQEEARMKFKNHRRDKETRYASKNLQMAAYTATTRSDNTPWDAEMNQKFQSQRFKTKAIGAGQISDDQMISGNVFALVSLAVHGVKKWQGMDKPKPSFALTKYEEEALIDFYTQGKKNRKDTKKQTR